MKTLQVHDQSFEEYISEKTLHEKVDQLARKLNTDYAGKNPLLVGLLNGSFIFAADLVRKLTFDHSITFAKVSSYEGLSSSEQLKTDVSLQDDISGRDIIILEDIVDTGFTLAQVIQEWKQKKPASIEVCSCLIKPEAIQHKVQVKYYGFAIPDVFVIGYGLDYNGKGRALNSIYKQKK